MVTLQKPSNLSLVTQVNLINFRNYINSSVTLDQFNVLFGNNGSGKTNFLEALSLLSPGKGLKGASFEELLNSKNSTFNLEVHFKIKNYFAFNTLSILGTSDNTSLDSKVKKIFLLDNEPLKKCQQLIDFIKPIWLTPKMDVLFLEESKVQRNFFDRLIFNLDPNHLTRINTYNKALKERNTLLKSFNRNDSWYTALEEILVTQGVAIAATRIEFLDKLNYIIKNHARDYFSNILLTSDGFIEKILANRDISALACENLIKDQLKNSRQTDFNSGTTSLGIHKSNVIIKHLDNNLMAKSCSTGEQKIILITIIIAFIKLILLEQKTNNIVVLLDEILVHLDNKIKNYLLEELLNLPVQLLITTTDINYFKNFKKYLNFIEVKNNNLTTIS